MVQQSENELVCTCSAAGAGSFTQGAVLARTAVGRCHVVGAVKAVLTRWTLVTAPCC